MLFFHSKSSNSQINVLEQSLSQIIYWTLHPKKKLEKYKTYQMAQRAYRGKDQGKPNKKDRRDIDHFLEGW